MHMPSALQPEHDETQPAHERVYRALRARILSGGMAPGDSLTLRGGGGVGGFDDACA